MFRTKPYFTVFGGSYVHEHHIGEYRFDVDRKVQGGQAAASWVVLCTLVAGISVFAAQIAYFNSAGLFH